MNISDFGPDNADAFARLNLEWLEKYFRIEAVDRAILSDPQESIIGPGGAILFASDGGEIVGTVALKADGDGVFELTKMAVTASHQGHGVGRALLDAAIARFRSMGGNRLYLESSSLLTPALTLYESAGFVHSARPAPSGYQRSDVYMVYQSSEKPLKTLKN